MLCSTASTHKSASINVHHASMKCGSRFGWTTCRLERPQPLPCWPRLPSRQALPILSAHAHPDCGLRSPASLPGQNFPGAALRKFFGALGEPGEMLTFVLGVITGLAVREIADYLPACSHFSRTTLRSSSGRPSASEKASARRSGD
jgi:hypothetical protein